MQIDGIYVVASLVGIFTFFVGRHTSNKYKNDRLEVWQSPPSPLGREWYWHRKSGNNEIISNGEGYLTQQGALKGAFRANPDRKVLYLKVSDSLESSSSFDIIKRRKVV